VKKILHILIAAIFIYNLMGYFVVFQVLKYQAKKEIKRVIKSQVPDSELTLITVTAENQDELYWFEDEKEFKYQDMMYDIVKKIQKGNVTYYYCIKDTQENGLFANLNDHIQNHVKNDLSSNKKPISVLQKAIKDYLSVAKFSFNGNDFVLLTYCISAESITSRTVEILVPPPKSIC
jgi:hypothetical protein